MSELSKKYPLLEFEIVLISTTGDIKNDVAFDKVGTKGMFVKELCAALYPGWPRALPNLRELVRKTNLSLAKGDPSDQRRAWIEGWGRGYTLHLRPHGV